MANYPAPSVIASLPTPAPCPEPWYPVVGLVGKKRSGKDTIARYLRDTYGFRRLAFADELKRAMLAVDPIVATWDGPEWGAYRLSEIVRARGWEEAKSIPEVRRLLQNYGVAIREIDPGFWIRPVWAQVVARQTPVVITDVRFRNEAEMVANAGGILVRIERPGIDDGDTHVSETELADYPTDYTLRNDADLPTLYRRVDVLMSVL